MASLFDMLVADMIRGGTLQIMLDEDLGERPRGLTNVNLTSDPNSVTPEIRVSPDPGGEPATIYWLPWKEDVASSAVPSSSGATANMLFLTSYFSGCKILSIVGGPIWHIDPKTSLEKCWENALDGWVDRNWPIGQAREVSYVCQTGADIWNLQGYLSGNDPSTPYTGQATVAGIFNARLELELYLQCLYLGVVSPWTRIATQSMTRLR